MADITQNPDYQLVMTFLQNIRPGDMDEESAQQLMIIGQRIQAGGVLSDQEREMFQSVVGATDRFPVEQMDTFPQGTNPDIMKQPAQRMAPAQGMAPVPMPQAPSSEMTVPMPTTQGGPMNMQEMIDAGIIVPKRPMTRPTAPLQSRRPMTRPTQ